MKQKMEEQLSYFHSPLLPLSAIVFNGLSRSTFFSFFLTLHSYYTDSHYQIPQKIRNFLRLRIRTGTDTTNNSYVTVTSELRYSYFRAMLQLRSVSLQLLRASHFQP